MTAPSNPVEAAFVQALQAYRRSVEAATITRHDDMLSADDYAIQSVEDAAAVLTLYREAVKDSERLDWMKAHYGRFRSTTWRSRGEPERETSIEWTEFFREERAPEKRTTTVAGDFRAAIDAAMATDAPITEKP